MKRWLLAGICSTLVAAATAATPNWNEPFTSLTGSPYNVKALPPTTVMADLTKPLDVTGDWVAGCGTGAASTASIVLDTTYGAGAITTGQVPMNNTARLLLDCSTTATGDDVEVISPVSTGAGNVWKYECYIGYPDAATTPGNFVIGVAVDDGAGGMTAGTNQNPMFQLQIGTTTANHQWRFVKAGTATNIGAPSVANTAFGQTWTKVGFEVDSTAKTFKCMLNGNTDFTYDFTALAAGTTWNLSKSQLMIHAFQGAGQKIYIDDVSYTTSGAAGVQDWKQQ